MKMRAGIVVVGALLALPGCSAISHRDLSSASCEIAACGSDPCPGSYHCMNGHCARCEAAAETCNGVDDDCDGLVDEGHDADGDCVTWCGGGDPAQADCDDNDPEVFPAAHGAAGAVETCDGRDNDCTGVVDDGVPPTLCPGGFACVQGQGCVESSCLLAQAACGSGQVCDLNANPPACVAGTNCNDVACVGPGEVCDTITGQCFVPSPNGTGCKVDGQCTSGQCTQLAVLRDSGADGICTSACCTDAQCGAGEVCHQSGTGARVCVGQDWAMTQRGASGEGAVCTVDTDCLSGVCLGNGRCMANCGSDADCAGLCGVRRYDSYLANNVAALACGPASGAPYGTTCASYADCHVKYCLQVGMESVCSGACRTSDDCSVTDLSGTPLTYCGYIFYPEPVELRSDFVQVCREKLHPGTATNGQTCAFHGDCLDNFCLNGRCSATCCTNADCGAGEQCRPTKYASHWEMRCNP